MSLLHLTSRFVRNSLVASTIALAGCGSHSPMGSVDVSPGSAALGASIRSPPDSGRLVVAQDDYRIGPSDIIEVKVFQVKDLDTTATVSGSGSFSMPLLGEVRAAGKTVSQLEKDIAARLGAKYLRDPGVHVTVKEYASQKFTVEGSVNGPGVFPLSGPTSLLQAIAQARGTTQAADTKSVLVFRIVDSKRSAARFDLSAIRDGSAQDPMLASGDVIVVGDSAILSAFDNVLKALPAAGVFALLL